MTFNVNGVPVTYNNLENATDAGAGQVNFNSGVNGVFDRKASTVESIKKVGDYFELIKPGTPSFDSEWIEITTNTDSSQPEVFNNLIRLHFTQTTFTLRDKTDVAVHTSTPENDTYRITRTLSGFEIKKNGVVVYESPVVCNDLVPKNEKETDLTQWLKTFTRLNGAEEVEQVVVNGRIASRLRDPGNQWSRYETTAQVPNDRPQKLLVEVGKQLGSTQTYYIRATYPSNTGDLQINLSTGEVMVNNINAGITPTDLKVKDLGDTWLITATFPPSTEYVNWWHGPALQSEAESGYVDIFQLDHDYDPCRCVESTTTLLPTTFTVTTGATIGGGVIVLGGAGAIGGAAERVYEVENIGKKHTLTFDHLFNGNAGQDTFFSYEVIENGAVVATGNYEANSATPVTESIDLYPTSDITIRFTDENPPGGGPSSDIRITSVNIDATCIPFTQQALETNKDFLLENLGNATATQLIDFSTAHHVEITLTQNTTLTFTDSDVQAGMMYLTVIQDATGGHTLSFPANVDGDTSSIPTDPNSDWVIPIYFTSSNSNPRYKL
jgi:hypothetical protein